MLKYLSIKNLILIQHIEINFQNGLSVFTGETGAGKSMILDSLSLISGGRTKSSIKPEKGKKTIVTAVIDIHNFPEILKRMDEIGVEVDNEIIVKRIVDEGGRSKSFINDTLVSLNTLKELTEDVIEIHSQFSEQGLLDNTTHIDTLDNFGTNKETLSKLKTLWEDLNSKEKLYKIELDEFKNLNDIKEAYDYDLKELKNLNPVSDEFDELEKKRKIIKNFIKINETLSKVNANFTSDSIPGIENLASENLKLLNSIEELLDEESSKQIKNLESMVLEISEISKFFRNYTNLEDGNRSIDDIEDRISLYKKLSKKHNVRESELSSIEELIRSKIILLNDGENKLLEIKKDLDETKKILVDYSQSISFQRLKNCMELDTKVNNEFLDLKLENANFKTFIEKIEYNAKGQDKVTFKIQTNPKSKMDEIKKISSGGELCRIALALKVTADKNKTSILFFDEVDSGIGGAVSAAVGQRLRRLGENRQVCVITHSPQVASVGQNHYKVSKSKFETKLIKLDSEERIMEIARMLSAKEITSEAIEAAKKLIQDSK
ncbi:MAG: DNA repair protein RecN [Alphaproteobacteria bacterium]